MSEASIEELYSGEQLVGDDSFLRRLPVALVTKERLRFDAIVIASDMIAQAFRDLRSYAVRVGADLDAFGNSGRAFMLSQCWTLIDQLHAIRQLLTPSSTAEVGPFTRAYLDASTPATMMRNDMDHLASKLDNLSKRKGRKTPLFGSLSYFHSDEVPPTGGAIITVMSGSLHGEETMLCVNPAGRQMALPADLFTFSAFDHQIEFGPAISALRDWIRASEANLEADIREQVAAQTDSDEEREKAMAALGGGIVVALSLKFNGG